MPDRITSREVQGMFFKQFEAEVLEDSLASIANLFPSDQASEEYAFLGQSPMLKEWIGGRKARGFGEYTFAIPNVHYEATIDIPINLMRRDKTGQIEARIGEMATKSVKHWNRLVYQLMDEGTTTVCYDGQFFYDTDHQFRVGDDTITQSNLIDVDISTLPTEVSGGTPALPSVEQMQMAIAEGIQQIVGFRDDSGEFCNEEATEFVVSAPLKYRKALHAALSLEGSARAFASQTGFDSDSMTILPNVSPRLSAANNRIYIHRTDTAVKPFVRQEETEIDFKAKAEGSDYAFDNNHYQYGIDTHRGAGYGEWLHSVAVNLV